ncbi:MAG: hypothetical protein CW338_08090 [Clostridiales bacterium]|nr:hypothetical protein [Clostridiales bacterium]
MKKATRARTFTADETGAPDFPADVKFILTVTNTSNVTAKNITVYQKDVTLATIPELKPGMTVTIPRLISVSAPGKFQWTASCKDELGNKMTFESEVIQFTREPAATAAPVTTPRAIPPVPTMVPFELREAELKAEFEDTISRDERLKKIMNVALPVLIVLTLAVLVLLIVAIIMRIIAAAKHASAYDSVDLVSQRDFKAVADSSEKKEPSEPSAEVPGDFRKESDYEPAVDLNDDSLTIGASGGSDSKPAEEAPAKEEPPKAEEPEEAPAAPAERHAVKREDPSEEE